jgi:hypothetical protein
MLELIGTTQSSTISGGNPYVEKILHRMRSSGIDSPLVAEIVRVSKSNTAIALYILGRLLVHAYDVVCLAVLTASV